MKNSIKNKLKAMLACLIVLPCTFMFAGCKSNDNELLSKINNLQTQIDALESANRNGSKPDTYDLYLSAVEKENYQGTYLDFIKNNLTISADTTSMVANKCTASVVSVYAKNSPADQRTAGSGIIYSIDDNGNAIVVTNYHIVYQAGSTTGAKSIFELYLYGSSQKINATFVGGSADYDIAVLKVEASDVLKNSNAQAVSIDKENTKLGKTVLAIGNPHADGISITRGVISRDSEVVNMTVAGQTKSRRVLRHDAYITNGSSGGGLFDMAGNLVGLTNGGEDEDHIKYAIPSSIVYVVTQNILKNCLNTNAYTTKNIYLNAITAIEETTSTYNKQTGFIDIADTIVLAQIHEDSVLKTTNVLQSGDVLKTLTINAGTENEIKLNLSRNFEIKEFLLLADVGDTLKIDAERNGTAVSTTITIRTADTVSAF